MQRSVLVKLHHLIPNSCSSFNHHHRCLATTHLPENPELHTSPTQEHNSHSFLLNICLQECKKIRSRQVFDQMPERVRLSLNTAKTIHARILKLGFSSSLDGKLENAVLDLYAKCGHTDYAEKVFSRLERRGESAWNSIMVMNSRKGMFGEVLRGFGCMWSCGVVGNQFSFAVVLSACSKLMDVELGKQVHCAVVKFGLGASGYCEGALIDMYVKCGHLLVAKRLFDDAVDPDTVSRTVLISGFAQVGLFKDAIDLFEKMQRAGHVPDRVVLVTVLNAFVGQGRLEEASRIFSQITNPNVMAWNIIISGHGKSGNEEDSIKIFKDMIRSGVQPSRSTLGSIFRAIATQANHEYGLQVHCLSVKLGLDFNVYAGSSLINMYAKCQKTEAAKVVFEGLEEKNVVSWNALLGGCAQNGHAREVFELFVNMKTSGFQPDGYTYTSLLSACACLENVNVGHQLHSFIIKNEFGVNLYVGNALIDMYAKCGALPSAMKVFEQMKNRDNISWNSLIVGYAQKGEEGEAFSMFRRRLLEVIAPDEVSLASLLSATANLQNLSIGRQVHCFLVKCGLEKRLYAGSSLIDMYCKCGIVGAAIEVYSCMPERSVVCLNALISGVARESVCEGVKLFKYMLVEGLQPSEVTFATLLEVSSSHNSLTFGRQIHCFILKLGLPYSDEFLAVSLLGMYMTAQRNDDAGCLFTEISHPKSTIIWTVMISGCIQNDYGEEALQWYQEMRRHDVMPDQATFASVLRACSTLASLEDGRKIHSFIFHVGYDKDELTGSVLVDMYAKCGDVKSSAQVFAEMISKKDVISWNSMIVGYAKNGCAEDALQVFDEMKQANVKPDEVTFLGVLTACSHAGMVSEGRELYRNMISCYRVHPRVEHCACMIDLFGRWGSLQEAESFIDSLDFEPDSMIWTTYLNVCRLHNDEIRGKHAAEKLIQLDPENSSSYVLLSNIHAASGKWDSVNFLREEMNERGVKKFPGCSWKM